MLATFPFAAIVGQSALKQALLICAVDRHVGGVLAFGDRGTGKSTTIRALADLLPSQEVVAGCAYRCPPAKTIGQCDLCQGGRAPGDVKREPAPVVDLPLGATEDRIVGALDLERALVHGEKRFEPGLLADAHGGFLYIDEVNLLEDHLVDVLLDVAASGENLVEREGLSVTHPAQFVLVGSGNPEEGELRPQLLDRFGLSVEVRTPGKVDDRIEIVRRRDTFERDPEGFSADWQAETDKIQQKIDTARETLATVNVPDQLMRWATEICIHLGTDGLRGELTLVRAARAAAALEGRTEVEVSDMRFLAPMALRHRLRKDPLDETDPGDRVERALAEVAPTSA
ncbi:MAG: magnesium chelatase ATPase subunit I [Pseudomonadota bacterium]